MSDTIVKTTEKATIDCSMVVIKTREGTPKVYGFTYGTKASIEANVEMQEAIKLIVKGVLKAQRPEKRILTGHTITLTNSLLAMELLPLFNGGELVKGGSGGTEIVGYNGPATGEEVVKTKFDLTLYSEILEGSSVVGYEEVIYPNCEGQPFGLNSEDDVFRISDITIVSAPGKDAEGQPERAMKMSIVEELPTITGGAA